MTTLETFLFSFSFGKALRVRLFLSVAAMIAAADISFAQSFSNTPNDTIYTAGMMEDLETLSIQQLNISTDTITLKWKKVSESVPLLWDASVCDNSICNTSLVDSGMMNPVVPTDYGLLLLHITAHVNYGTAIIRYAIWDTANPALKDTLTYILTVAATSGIAAAENKNDFSIFPNPAKENISLFFEDNKQHQFEIFNAVGEKIYSGNATGNCILPISNWNNGLYTVSVYAVNKIINTKKFFIQQ